MLQMPDELKIHITGDGSPTLSVERDDGYVERMHHSGGALSESLYIYHSALVGILEKDWPARVLSFGLGMGYNELLALAEAERRGLNDTAVWSFESRSFLRSQFEVWLEEGPGQRVLMAAYNQIAAAIGARLGLDAERVRLCAQRALREGRLQLRGSFPEDSAQIRDCTVVFYDAFSNKMHSGPWSESTLENRLAPLLAPQCVLTTYAATGSLNRALKKLGFRLLRRPGFQGKRESTLAIRENPG